MSQKFAYVRVESQDRIHTNNLISEDRRKLKKQISDEKNADTSVDMWKKNYEYIKR